MQGKEVMGGSRAAQAQCHGETVDPVMCADWTGEGQGDQRKDGTVVWAEEELQRHSSYHGW